MKILMSFILLTMILPSQVVGASEEFRLQSRDIANHKLMSTENVLNGFDCTGGNQSPGLYWNNAPEGTKSFAVTAYDPDALTGSGWWHWIVFNIDKGTQSLRANSGSGNGLLEGAIHGRNGFGQHGYGGACPPKGEEHRYQFTVYALDVEGLPVDDSASAAMIGYFIHSHMLGKSIIAALYKY